MIENACYPKVGGAGADFRNKVEESPLRFQSARQGAFLDAVSGLHASRQALHAQRLGLIHPRSRKECEWAASLPDDFASLIARAGIELSSCD